MKKRQLKKIMDTYVMDVEEDFLVPPSTSRREDREMEKYFQKAWMISNPEKSKAIFEAMEKAYAEAECECGCGCGCHHDHDHECNGDHECHCHEENGECCCEK